MIDGDGSGEPALLVGTPQGEEHAQISPDGKYVAYTSADSGRDEIYIKRFPSGEGRWQASVDGGNWARWHPAGGELFFIRDDDRLMAVDVVRDSATPSVGNPTRAILAPRRPATSDGCAPTTSHRTGRAS